MKLIYLILIFLFFGITLIYPQSNMSLGNLINYSTALNGCNVTLDSGNTGTRTFKFASPGTAEITPLLSTSGPAEIKVVTMGSSGAKKTWLKWNRTSGYDPGPLYINGVKNSKSMTSNGGDWSPKRPPDTYKQSMNIGDQIQISLNGNFGIGNPYVTFKTTAQIVGNNPVPSNTTPAGTPSGSGWKTFNVKQNGSISVNIPFNRKWEVEYNMKVIAVTSSGQGHPRMFESSERFEILNERGSGLGFRLANRKIWFTSASKGKIQSPGAQTNHYLSMSARAKTGSKHKFNIHYDNGNNNVKIYMDGQLIGDSSFQEKNRARAINQIKFPFSEGTFSYKLK